MKLYEEYYGKVLTWDWVCRNLRDAHFVCEKGNGFDIPERHVKVLAAFSTTEERHEFITPEFKQKYKQRLCVFRSDYSDPMEYAKIRAIRPLVLPRKE